MKQVISTGKLNRLLITRDRKEHEILIGADLTQVKFNSPAILSELNLSDAILENLNLSSCNIRNCTLTGASFKRSQLHKANLEKKLEWQNRLELFRNLQ